MSTTTIAPEWESLHVFAHGDRSTADHLYLAAAEEGRRAIGEGLASGWFALRYWEGGPHIRLRLRDTRPGLADAVAERLAARTGTLPGTEPFDGVAFPNQAGSPSTVEAFGWQPTGTVLRPGYRPDTARYGGPEAMPLGEDLFQLSSEIAAEALPDILSGTSRTGTALKLLAAHVAGLLDAGFDEVTIGTALRRSALAAAARPGAPRADVPAARARAECEYEQQPEQFRAAVGRLRAEAGRLSGLPGRWAAAVHDYARQLQALGPDLQRGPWPALTSQWHMLANRLGVSVSGESFLTWLAGLTLSGSLTGPDAQGVPEAQADPTTPLAPVTPLPPETAARPRVTLHTATHITGHTAGRNAHATGEFLQAVKFQRDAMSSRTQRRESARPHPVGDGESYPPAPLHSVPRPAASHDAQPRTAPYRLPAADPALLAAPALAELLGSPAVGDLGGCTGVVDAARLGTLLGLAARVAAAPPAAAAVGFGGREHPAPELRPLLVDVLVRRVPGIPAGNYRYLADEHALAPCPAVDTGTLLSAVPYAAPRPAWHRPTAAAEAPVLLLLGTAPGVSTLRYGPRGARSALLEAGRLTQSLLLTATALDLRAATVCGGYDELAVASGHGEALTQPLCLVAIGAAP
ncbi:thiopeptide-type bacteriocin biosynthesis protein [Kitasatospora sp. McL0602]|uniref:thiopeptide-type bacteriocin biosynthesis protein n=1 Tax=Kitasatospora sp. McL0602 TaxID=3439530 RepID=UPI003F8B91DD